MPSKVAPSVTEVTAGIDWVSVTLGRNELDYQVWKGDCYYALGEIAKTGNQLISRKLQGFEGLSCDNCFVGENETMGFAQFTGEKANWAFEYAHHIKAHCSRIDVQITVQTDIADVNQGKRNLREARNYNKTLPKARQRKIDFWLGENGADTVYIGSASSDQRGRIYNKEAQSEDIQYTKCWRYEAVFRNDYGTRMFRKLFDKDTARTDECVSQVVEFFRQRGVSIRSLEHIVASELRPMVKKPSDVERKLEWLRKQVQPTIRKLRELGYYTEGVTAALGDGWEEDRSWSATQS